MKKIVTITLLALITLASQGQTTGTATIQGYSPALEDSTGVDAYIDMMRVASDTVIDGHFKLTIPVEKLTDCNIFLLGVGCPNFLKTIYVAPDAVVSMTGEDCLFQTWKVESTLPEQATANRITDHIRNTMNRYLQILYKDDAPDEVYDSVYCEMLKQTIDILPSLPVDYASLTELAKVSIFAKNEKDFPYMEQLKAVEKDYATRAPKGFENELEYIHSLVYPLHILQPGEEAVDADFFDMDGNTHHLSELRGRYVLLDFWSLGCGPCRLAEPEMREAYESLNGKLEIVGINLDNPSGWRESDWSKKLVWQNWSDGKMSKGGIVSRYNDEGVVPYYVLLSPDQRIVWKASGYSLGMFTKMAASLKDSNADKNE